MIKYILPTLVAIAAFALAGIAAFYSITGMTKFFTGVATPIIIMMVGIEFGKLVLASVVHRNWKDLKAWKWISILFIVVVMFITSLGVFGFLSAAYDRTVAALNVSDGAIALEEAKKPVLEGKIASYEKSIDRKSERIDKLNDIRDEQEVRLDSLYARGWHTTARKTRESIAQQNREIGVLNSEVDSLNNEIQVVFNEIARIDSTVIMLANNATQGEIGAVKYFAKAIEAERDQAAFIVIYALIFVCDPMAVTLVFLFNIVLDKARKPEEEEEVLTAKEPEAVPEPKPEPKKELLVSEPVDFDWKEEPEPEPEKKLLVSEPVDLDWKEEVEPEPEIEPEPEPEPKKEIKPEIKEEVENVSSILNDELSDLIKANRHVYISLLDPLYDGDKLKVGSDIGPIEDLLARTKKYNLDITQKTIEGFLFTCNMFGIARTEKGYGTILKSKEDAKTIMELL